MTKVGVVLPQQTDSLEPMLSAARAAEEQGLDSVWLSDHLWGRKGPQQPFIDATVALAAVAETTERVEVGSLVIRAGLRLPRLVVESFRTLARIAPGRVTLGLGLGDDAGRAEEQAFGYSISGRETWVKETLALVERLEVPVRTLVGGGSDRAMALAHQAGAWNLWGPVERMGELLGRFRALAGPMEASWGGMYPGSDAVVNLAADGVDHIIVAVGAHNYSERVSQLADDRARLGAG